MPEEKLALIAGLLKGKKEIIVTEDVLKLLGWTEDSKRDLGRAIGGVLSSLHRLVIPEIGNFFIPIGQEKIGSRRLRWKIDAKVLSEQTRNQLLDIIDGILKERSN